MTEILTTQESRGKTCACCGKQALRWYQVDPIPGHWRLETPTGMWLCADHLATAERARD